MEQACRPHSELKKIAARPTRGKPEMSKSFLSFLLFVTLTFLTACDRGRERTNVLTGDGEPEVTVMDFSAPFSLDPLPAGWYHRTFWTRGPMQMAFAVKEGVPALRLETRSTASMLFRHVDFDLADYRLLVWRWYIEEPIESPLDEHTREGDDHPARLFLVFRTATGEERRMEIIWAISSKPETTNISEGFPIMSPTAATRTFVNGSASKLTCARSTARFGRMGRLPISSTLQFSAIPTRPTAAPLAILPMSSYDAEAVWPYQRRAALD
jgi:Protein of unknown function (DUF3047)